MESPKWEIYDEYRPFQVAGVCYHQESFKRFTAGECQSLEVKHEPVEEYPHALAVYGVWVENEADGADDFKEAKIGYIPDWLAKKVYAAAAELGLADRNCRIVPDIFELDRSRGRVRMTIQLEYKSK